MTHPKTASTAGQQAALQDFQRWAQLSYIIDTETTGLKGEVFEISVRHIGGEAHTHLLTRPHTASWEAGAREMHAHRLSDILQCPHTLREHHQTLQEITRLAPLVAYNAAFDNSRLNHTSALHGLDDLQFRAECAMLAYTRLRNETYQSSRGGKRQRSFKLFQACLDEGVCLDDLTLHGADHDATALLRLITHVNRNWN